jgi:ABC-type branched-subunit amino acid transport system substrate-binding protein/DNA-binding beta-propeller fold protein YncE
MPTDDRHLILLVEESNNSLGFFDSEAGLECGRVSLSLWPHEVAVSPNGKTAYVSNFGLRDYDLTLGHAGNSISVIDIAARCETHRLYTCDGDFRYWAPHGVKVTPDGNYLFANVERVLGSRQPDLTLGPGTDQTDMLVFDLATNKPFKVFALPPVDRVLTEDDDPVKQYGVPRGSHNFVFAKDGKSLWLFSGRGGISRVDPLTGAITAQLKTFAGAVRGLQFFEDGRLLVSATNELTILDPDTLQILWRMSDLGVTQILYSEPLPDGKTILAPAVWEGQVLVIDVDAKKIVKSLTTGVDPVHIICAYNKKSAYVTHGRSKWAAEISFDTLEIVRLIPTRGGPNGAAVAPWQAEIKRGQVCFGATLPFTGEYAVEGREIRLGLEFWQQKVNSAGGIKIGSQPCYVNIAYEDSGSKTETAPIAESARRLIQAGAQLLFGSFPEETYIGLAEAAAEARIPLLAVHGLNGKQNDDVGFVLGPTQVLVAEPALKALLRQVTPRPSRVLLATSNLASKIQAAELTRSVCNTLGLSLVQVKSREYFILNEDGSALDCMRIADQTYPDILIHLGTRKDALEILKAVVNSDVTLGAVVLDCCVNNSNFMAAAGDMLVNVIGSVYWTERTQNCAHDRFTCGEDFARDYFDEFSERSSTFAAGAASCGVLYQDALTRAQTVDVDAVIDSLAALTQPTIFCDVLFDEYHYNKGARLLAIQMQRAGKDLNEVLIWPRDANHRLEWPFRS